MVECGAARFSLDATQQRAEEGQLFVLEPEAVHTGMAAVPEGWAYKVLYVEPELPARVRRARPDRAACCSVGRLQGRCAARWPVSCSCRPGYRAARFGDRSGGPVRDRRAASAPTPWSVGASSARAEHAAVRRARQHLCDRWDQRVALADLAVVAGLSQFELIRCFRADTGLTPHAYQVNLRISRARALRAGEITPAVVAAECGFSDQPHLTRTFKRAVGLSTGRYARSVVG